MTWPLEYLRNTNCNSQRNTQKHNTLAFISFLSFLLLLFLYIYFNEDWLPLRTTSTDQKNMKYNSYQQIIRWGGDNLKLFVERGVYVSVCGVGGGWVGWRVYNTGGILTLETKTYRTQIFGLKKTFLRAQPSFLHNFDIFAFLRQKKKKKKKAFTKINNV